MSETPPPTPNPSVRPGALPPPEPHCDVCELTIEVCDCCSSCFMPDHECECVECVSCFEPLPPDMISDGGWCAHCEQNPGADL